MKLREAFPLNFGYELDRLKRKKKLGSMVIRYSFSVEGSFQVDPNSISFYAEKKQESRQLALEVGKLFGVKKWEREFSSWNGEWHYSAQFELGNRFVLLTVWDAPMPDNCTVVSYTETVTKFKKECEGE